MRSLLAMTVAVGAVAAQSGTNVLHGGFDIIAAPSGPIHHRGRLKPKARQEAHRRAKRIGKRRQQGRLS